MKLQNKKKMGISAQINLVIILGVLIAGVITFFSQNRIIKMEVRNNMAVEAERAALELLSAIKEYPAYDWLLEYWYENADRLDVEYDVDFGSNTKTEKKRMIFSERNPGIQIRYCTRATVESLSDEDQKLYAEIAYSWILTRVNESKRNLGCDFLYLVVTGTDNSEHPYQSQCFLLSGADADSTRGAGYKDVYTLGVTVPVREDNSSAGSMREAVNVYLENGNIHEEIFGESLSGVGDYIDYYECLYLKDDHAFLVGVSYDIRKMNDQIRYDTLRRTLIAAAYQLLLLEIVMLHLSLFVIRPLKRVLQNIRLYTETGDSAVVNKNLAAILSGKWAVAIRQNEIGQLAEDFSVLTQTIDDNVEQIRTVTSQNERMETELYIASRIQTQVLPDETSAVLQHDEYDLAAVMFPAREVGGDFYDYFFADQEHLVLVIGDVSDKGMPAALFMMITKALIKDHAIMGECPQEILTHVNDQLMENNKSNFFVTVWLVVINVKTGKGVGVNAGHGYPAICKAGESYELLINKHSPVIGLLPGIRYRQYEFQIKPGDKVFVYTDGITEAENRDHEQFGTERMLDVLNRNRDARSKDLLNRMKEEIDDFVGDAQQFDDMTMLIFQYKGLSADET